MTIRLAFKVSLFKISLSKHPALPAVLLAAGMFLSLSGCLWLGFFPPFWLQIAAVIGGLTALWYRQFFLLGVGLGLIAVAVNTTLPYGQSFSRCHFQAVISQPNYSTLKHTSRETRLQTSEIQCDLQTLPAQTIIVRDWQRQLVPYTHDNIHLSAATLSPVHTRLNPGSFDYERYWLGQGIRLTAKKIQITPEAPLKSPLLRLKNHLAENIISHLPRQQAAIALALVTGNRSALSPQQKQFMQRTGTSHLLAISGLHLSLIGGLAWLLGQWLWGLSFRLSDKVMPIQAGAITALVVITLYAFLTGFDIPVKRAWIMFSLLIISWLWQKSLTENSLLLAAVAVMLIEPYAVVSVGFYFSFLATYIVLWSMRLPYPPLIQIIVMQGLINLTLFPITWFIFGTVSFSAFFVNLLVIPWLGLAVLPPLIGVALLSLPLPAMAEPLWAWVAHSIQTLWQVIAFFERLPLTLNPALTPALPAVIVAVLAMLCALMTRRWYWAAGILAVWLPLSTTAPALLIADSRYSSLLIHNGKEAIVINPGRQYRTLNQAKKWQRYLHKYHIKLSAIVLQNKKLSSMSSTHWLSQQFPQAQIITLKPMHLPYPHVYCHSIHLENLQLITRRDKTCQASLNWFEQTIRLSRQATTDNDIQALLPRSRLQWYGQIYDANQSGAISVQYQNGNFILSALRDKPRLWRKAK